MTTGFTPHEPPQGDSGTCRSCGAAVVWTVTAAGRRMPMDANPTLQAALVGPPQPTYVSHFATCPQAETWRKR